MQMIWCLFLLNAISYTYGNDACTGNPNKKIPAECCDIPLLEVLVSEKCVLEYAEQTLKVWVAGADHGCCVSECTFNETKIYSGNGVINQTVLTNKILDNVVPEWKDKTPEIIESCFKEATGKTAEFQKQLESPLAYPGEMICHPISGYMIKCLYETAFRHCPDSKFTKNSECDALKAYALKCPLDYIEL